MTFDELVATSDTLARAHGLRLLVVGVHDQVVQFRTDGEPGAIGIVLSRAVSLSQMDDALAEVSPGELLPAAGTLVKAGIALRTRSEFAAAYTCARVALWMALRLGDARGVEVVTANIIVIREAARDVLERGRGPLRRDVPPDQRAAVDEWGAALDALVALIRADARNAWVRVAPRVAAMAMPGASAPSNDECVGALRLALLAGRDLVQDTQRTVVWEPLRREALRTGAWDVALTMAAEGLLDVSLDDVVLEVPSPACDRYFEVRQHLGQIAATPGLLNATNTAFRHLDNLRVKLTAAGGAFGHVLSYRASGPVQAVGRDLVLLLHRAGAHAQALVALEAVRARALTDWMGRTHPHQARFPRQFLAAIHPFEGSINAAEPAGLEELKAAAASAEMPVVAYLAMATEGFVVAVLRPDGTVNTEEIPDPRQRVAAIVERLPYQGVADAAQLFSASSTAAIDDALRALGDAVWTDAVRKAVAGYERVAVLADGVLEAVPFSALRDAEGYLVERHEIVHWPSVTAWMMMRDAADVLACDPRWLPGLALGRTTFEADAAPEGQVLPPLKYAADEARAVAQANTLECLVEQRATWEALATSGRALGIVHIATHGVLDLEKPEHSYLALADGPLTAGALYRYDPGLRAGLVVLSACQTALGAANPDSVIGLANAFLVAGANAVLATLWQIPDVTTLKLMGVLYAHQAQDRSVTAALCAAQRACLASAHPAMRSPVTWGAFKASGLSVPVPRPQASS